RSLRAHLVAIHHHHPSRVAVRLDTRDGAPIRSDDQRGELAAWTRIASDAEAPAHLATLANLQGDIHPTIGGLRTPLQARGSAVDLGVDPEVADVSRHVAYLPLIVGS